MATSSSSKKRSKPVKRSRAIKMQTYILVFDNSKTLFGGIKNRIYTKGFTNDPRGQDRKAKFIEQLKKKNINHMELTLTNKQRGLIAGASSISFNDINQLLEIVYDSLASNEGLESVKRKIISSKENVKYNPIILISLEQGQKIEDLLKYIDFPFKKELMEVISNDTITSIDKYKKIEKILYFKEVNDSIKRGFIKQGAMFGGYLSAMILILCGVKYVIFPLVVEKLAGGLGLDTEKMIGESRGMIEGFFYIIIGFGCLVFLLLLIRIFSKPTFMSILYRMPKLKSILQLGKTLSMLTTFTFFYNQKLKFRKKIFEMVNYDFPIEEDTSLQGPGEVVLHCLNTVKKKHGVVIFDPLVAIGLDGLVVGGGNVVEEVSERKINNYIKKMQISQKELGSIISTITIFIVAVLLMITMGAILSISFNALSSMNQ